MPTPNPWGLLVHPSSQAAAGPAGQTEDTDTVLISVRQRCDTNLQSSGPDMRAPSSCILNLMAAGFSGAQLANMVNEAALGAAKLHAPHIDLAGLEQAQVFPNPRAPSGAPDQPGRAAP